MKSFLFPLTQSNLFPSTTKPLNIFEAKYIQMIEEAIATKTTVAIGYVPENGDTYRSIAGYGHPEIIDRRVNGTFLVFIAGIGKIRIREVVEDLNKPFIIIEGDVIKENLSLNDDLKPKYTILSTVLAKWVQKNISEQRQREVFIESLKSTQDVIGAIAAYLIRDYDLQYELMEINSSDQQLKFLFRLFESKELTV